MNISRHIQQECFRRGITRLCHFTPSRNLAHIIAGKIGVLSTSQLEDSERQIFNATDLERIDGHKGHICCSIEYPNVWYFSRTRNAELLFKDWVVLLIKPDYLWEKGTLFCPRNAAAGRGCYIVREFDGFQKLYQQRVQGAGGRTIARSNTHLPSCPTDNQAEVLIPDCIKLSDITGVIIRDEDQARNELLRLRLQKLDIMFDFYVVPAFYKKYVLSEAISGGQRPEERVFTEGGLNGQ